MDRAVDLCRDLLRVVIDATWEPGQERIDVLVRVIGRSARLATLVPGNAHMDRFELLSPLPTFGDAAPRPSAANFKGGVIE